MGEGKEGMGGDRSSGSDGLKVRSGEMGEALRERLEALAYIESAADRTSYLARQREVAVQLGMSLRNVQRLLVQWRERGVEGVERVERRDKGQMRLEGEWEAYILETYREGNRRGNELSRSQVAKRVAARAQLLGEAEYPSRSSVYRVLAGEVEGKRQRERVKSLGWTGEELILRTRSGGEIKVERSNQVWQVDHTKLDVFVVGQDGVLLGRPWLSLVVDTHSRCIMGMHLGMESPSAEVVCLSLRHAILPKHYSRGYELSQGWGTYGVPQYLYTDSGKDFKSGHIEQVASELKIVLHQRRYPAEGGIVERPFGTINSEVLSQMPGYTGGSVKRRSKSAERKAKLTLGDLEKRLVRYIVENYNASVDARSGDLSRMGRWEAGRLAEVPLLSERELDICLMRRSRRVVYRGGYIQFANLSYRGEHLEGYAGSWVVMRYNPGDITSILLYREEGGKDRFLTRAHATGLETEHLSLAEAMAMSRRLREKGRLVSNQSILAEVRTRDIEVKALVGKRGRSAPSQRRSPIVRVEPDTEPEVSDRQVSEAAVADREPEGEDCLGEVPDVAVYDYEQRKAEYELW